MNISLTIVMLLGAGIIGLVGWKRATKHIYRRSLYDEGRAGVSRREYERETIRRRKIRRLVSTLFHALFGAAVGAVAWAFFVHVAAGVPAVGFVCCVARSRRWPPDVVGEDPDGVFGSTQLGRQAITAS